MSHLTQVLAVVVFFSSSLSVIAQNKLDECRRLWEQHRYPDAVKSLQEYRSSTRDRSLEVDYMIATSFCRVPETRDRGYELLKRIGQRQGVSVKNREILKDETSKCSGSESFVQTRPETLMLATVLSRSGVRGKAGDSLDIDLRDLDSAINEPVETLRDFPVEVLRKRLFNRVQEKEAIAVVQGLVPQQFKVIRIGRFIFATSSGQTDSQLRQMGASLDEYISFYQTQYGLSLPDKFITIYLVPDEYEMGNLARKIHGIRISHETIGYSVYEDLSVVAIIPQNIYGTLSHELFHLMVREKFSDIPPWLEEGMASAYAVATRRGNKIYALPNWRGAILRKFLYRRLTIEQLLAADWSMFEVQRVYDGSEVQQKATAYALANYFVLYLQEQGKLQAVFKAFYDQDISDSDLTRDSKLVDVRLLESVLGKSLPDVDRSFNPWFRSFNRQPVSPY